MADKAVGASRQPGYTVFWGDGNGRDSYIVCGNAGLIKPHAADMTPPRVGYQPPGTTNMYHGPVKTFYPAQKEATVFRYWGDGQGRDSYIVKDSGGLVPGYPTKSSQACFYQTLRKYNQSPGSF